MDLLVCVHSNILDGTFKAMLPRSLVVTCKSRMMHEIDVLIKTKALKAKWLPEREVGKKEMTSLYVSKYDSSNHLVIGTNFRVKPDPA